MIVILSALFILSLVGNILCLIFWNKRPQKQNDRTAEELLHDLTAYGNALIKVERIAPQNVLLRSPRQ